MIIYLLLVVWQIWHLLCLEGGPVESVISATGGAPHPLISGVLMMILMAIILFTGLLPKMGKYIPSESIAGFYLY